MSPYTHYYFYSVHLYCILCVCGCFARPNSFNLYLTPRTVSRVSNSEVGAIVDEIGNARSRGYSRDIVVQHVGGPIFSLPAHHRLVDALTYPILFPCGDDGWGKNNITLTRPKGKQKHVTAHQYLRYRLQRRGGNRNYHMLHGRLTQEWIINNFLKVEGENLDYLQSKAGQKQIRCEKYKEVREAQRLNRFLLLLLLLLALLIFNDDVLTDCFKCTDWDKREGTSYCRALIVAVHAIMYRDIPIPWRLSECLVNHIFSRR